MPKVVHNEIESSIASSSSLFSSMRDDESTQAVVARRLTRLTIKREHVDNNRDEEIPTPQGVTTIRDTRFVVHKGMGNLAKCFLNKNKGAPSSTYSAIKYVNDISDQ